MAWGELFHNPPTSLMSGPGPKPGLPSLGAACPLPPSADIGPGGQSVGQAAQFCLAQMSRAVAAITTPVTNAAKQENSKRSSRILDRVASPAPTLAIGPSSGVDQLRLFKIDHPRHGWCKPDRRRGINADPAEHRRFRKWLRAEKRRVRGSKALNRR